MQQQKWLDRGECPACGSSDANVNHSTGYSYCFSCKTRFGYKNENIVSMPTGEVKRMGTIGEWGEISERNISLETTKKFNTKIKRTGNITTHHLYGYYNDKGEHLGNKIRQTKDKRMWVEGEITNAVLFGQNIFNQKAKYITICEGELDAMSAYELMGSKWPSVSIKTGAAGAIKDCKNAFDYLDKYDKEKHSLKHGGMLNHLLLLVLLILKT